MALRKPRKTTGSKKIKEGSTRAAKKGIKRKLGKK